jgi:predicted alpha/beta hydrolase family esterase
MQPATKIIIIHGNGGGTGSDQWIPWLKKQLESRGFEVLNPTFPDNYDAKRSIWIPYLDTLKVDDNTIIVGWSSGAIAAMRYAEEHTIKALVLVGACYTDLGEESEKISGYYDDPWQWNAIKSNQKWIAQFGSINDPVIPIEESRFVHEKLGTEYYEFPDKFHFGYPESMPTFPELLEVILTHEATGL